MNDNQYVDFIVNNCEAYQAAGLWSRPPRVNPRGWLQNFQEDEKPAAAAILDRLCFFSATAIDNLLRASFLGYISKRHTMSLGFGESRQSYDSLMSDLKWTDIQGESPHKTDSGNFFLRKARDTLSIKEEVIVNQIAAISNVISDKKVMFIDDFIGTGDQVIETWKREYSYLTFEDVVGQKSGLASMLCLVATRSGLDRIRHEEIQLDIFPAHIVDDSDSIQNFRSKPFAPPSASLSSIKKLLCKYGPQLDVPVYVDARYGYRSLGLTIAFEHSVPDATLPIIWAMGGNNWQRLVEI